MEDQKIVARGLVESLDAAELLLLRCLVRGMSSRSGASVLGVTLDEFEVTRASMMRKLGAVATADAVRIGIYAGVDLEG